MEEIRNENALPVGTGYYHLKPSWPRHALLHPQQSRQTRHLASFISSTNAGRLDAE